MTGSDLDVPGGFALLDVKMAVDWSEPSKSWIGVVDSVYAECPPDGDGLTPCNKNDFQYISGGLNRTVISHWIWNRAHTDSFPREEGADLDDQLVTIQTEIAIAPVLELIFIVIGMVLLICAIEMIYPVEVLWKRFQNG